MERRVSTTSIDGLEFGFLPKEPPLTRLPPHFELFDEFVGKLPLLLKDPQLVKITVDDLPMMTVSDLPADQSARAFLVYGLITNALVHSVEERPIIIPAQLSQPFCLLADSFGMKPILSYYLYTLLNWELKNKSKGIVHENIKVINPFSGTPDEDWFVATHVTTEHAAIPAIHGLLGARQALKAGSDAQITAHLQKAVEALPKMAQTIERMTEGTKRKVFVKHIRPYFMSYERVIYEGVEQFGGKPQSFNGTTAAQSSILPLFDAALGVEHKPTPMTVHINTMKQYMPRHHRNHINRAKSSRRPLREHINNSGSEELKQLYDMCILGLHEFRDSHMKIVMHYLGEDATSGEGTGGTKPFITWLEQLKRETLQALLLPHNREEYGLQ